MNNIDKMLGTIIGKNNSNKSNNKIINNFGLKSFGGKNDLDFDGVPNKRDCQPRNTMRQDAVKSGWHLDIILKNGFVLHINEIFPTEEKAKSAARAYNLAYKDMKNKEIAHFEISRISLPKYDNKHDTSSRRESLKGNPHYDVMM